MEVKKEMYPENFKLIVEEAKKWENLEYAFTTIKEYIYSELENGETTKSIFSKCRKIYQGMDEERFEIARLIGWGAEVTVFHKKIAIEIQTDSFKKFLISYFISDLFRDSHEDEEIEKEFSVWINDGALGNTDVIHVKWMKSDFNAYIEEAEENLEHDIDYYGKKYDCRSIQEQMECVKCKLRELEKISDTIPVLRVKILGDCEGQGFDSDYYSETKKVVKKLIHQENTAYIFLLEDNLYIVDISDPV